MGSSLEEDPLAEHQNGRREISKNFCRGIGLDAGSRRDRPMHFAPNQNDPGLNFRPHEGFLPDDERSLALHLSDEFPLYLDGSVKNQLSFEFASRAQEGRGFFLNRRFAQVYSFLSFFVWTYELKNLHPFRVLKKPSDRLCRGPGTGTERAGSIG